MAATVGGVSQRAKTGPEVLFVESGIHAGTALEHQSVLEEVSHRSLSAKVTCEALMGVTARRI
jgi:hypothetical protein